MGANYSRPLGSRCHAHDACETCMGVICDDCPDLSATCCGGAS